MKIYVASDHNGFRLKEQVLSFLSNIGIENVDIGEKELDPSDDYPVYAKQAALSVLSSDDEDPRAILLCASGQGMCMAANRFKGIRAAIGWDSFEIKAARNDDDSNVLCLPAKLLEGDSDKWQDIIMVWLNTPFAGAPRFIRRINQMDEHQ